jgi:putative addiction module killer protein/probable addiction module antidote protein
LSALRAKEQAQIESRLLRIKDFGHFGDFKSLEGCDSPLFELRWANGWRIYFYREGHVAVMLLLGGKKMIKKKISKKQRPCLENMPIIKSKKSRHLSAHDPSRFFKDHAKVAEALLQSLEENDSYAFLEILNTYLYVNRTKVAKEAGLSRTTVQNALSSKSNPTIRTIAKIVHQAVA